MLLGNQYVLTCVISKLPTLKIWATDINIIFKYFQKLYNSSVTSTQLIIQVTRSFDVHTSHTMF